MDKTEGFLDPRHGGNQTGPFTTLRAHFVPLIFHHSQLKQSQPFTCKRTLGLFDFSQIGQMIDTLALTVIKCTEISLVYYLTMLNLRSIKLGTIIPQILTVSIWLANAPFTHPKLPSSVGVNVHFMQVGKCSRNI